MVVFETLTDVRDKNGYSPLDLALHYQNDNEGNYDTAAFMIMNHGCGSDNDKALLLCGACRWGKLDMVKELIEKHNLNPNGE